MKTKMKLTHEYMQNTLNLLRKHDIPYDFKSLIEESFEYAEAMIAKEDKASCNGLNTENLNIQGILHSIDSYFDQAECTKTIRAANNLLEEIYEKLSGDTISSESCSEEWQPDWSQAPEWANWWAMDINKRAYYFKSKPYLGSPVWFVRNVCDYDSSIAPSHNYQGDWKDSLRERPL